MTASPAQSKAPFPLAGQGDRMWDRVRFPSPSWPGEVPAIHVAAAELRIAESRLTSERTYRNYSGRTTWMAGTSPAMTDKKAHMRFLWPQGGRETLFLPAPPFSAAIPPC